MKELLITLCEYNIWANQRIILFLKTIPGEFIDAPVMSSFSTIRKTIYHIWDAQVIWLSRLQGISLNKWPSEEYGDNFAGYDLYFIQQSEDFLKFVETRSEGYFESTCFYKSMNGKDNQTKNGLIIAHCMNHSTYHRGQIITMLRTLGITDLIETDLIEYTRELQNKSADYKL